MSMIFDKNLMAIYRGKYHRDICSRKCDREEGNGMSEYSILYFIPFSWHSIKILFSKNENRWL